VTDPAVLPHHERPLHASTPARRPGRAAGRAAGRPVLARVGPWDRAAAGVVVAGAAAWAWLAAGGGLQLDDLRAQAYAADQPFWPFIVQSNRTHLSPGARTVDWLHSRFAPWEWWPGLLLILLVTTATGVLTYWLLRRLVGAGPAALVGVFWAMACPALIPGFAWYRQALTIGVPTDLMLVSVAAALTALRRGRWVPAVVAVLAHALALSFSERAVLLPVALLVAMVLLGGRSGESAGWRVLRRPTALAVLGAMAVTNTAFLLAYRAGDFDDASSGTPTLLGLAESTLRSIFRNTLPAFVGGPVSWRRVLGGYSFADTPLVLAVLGSGVVLAVLALALRRRAHGSRTLRVAAVSLSYALPVYVLIYVGRISRDKVTSVDDLRLYNDVVIVLAIALAVALADLEPGAWLRGRRRVPVVLLGVSALVLTGVSWIAWGRTWHSTTSRAYLATAVREVRAAHGSILPSSFPDSILPAYYQTDISTQNLVRLVNPAIETTSASARPQILDWSGHVVPAAYRLVARRTPPSNFCGFRLAPGLRTLTIDYDAPVPYQRSELVLLRVLAPDTTALHVTVVDADGVAHDVVGDTRPTLYRGPHELAYQVPWQTRVRAVRVTPAEGHAGLCVTDAPIVLAVPK
jgi:hypothetical protein